MSDGQIIGSEMSGEELAKLSPPRETEGSVPETGKTFGNVSLESADAACAQAHEQADAREESPEESTEESPE